VEQYSTHSVEDVPHFNVPQSKNPSGKEYTSLQAKKAWKDESIENTASKLLVRQGSTGQVESSKQGFLNNGVSSKLSGPRLEKNDTPMRSEVGVPPVNNEDEEP
jgi:hypothetical protein